MIKAPEDCTGPGAAQSAPIPECWGEVTTLGALGPGGPPSSPQNQPALPQGWNLVFSLLLILASLVGTE